MKKFINWSKEKGFNPWELGITILITITVFLWGLVSYFLDDDLGVNGLGDFFAGIFTPIAFYWLIRGYMLQKQELQQNTKALELQAEELKNTVEEYKQLVEINRSQLSLYRYEAIKPKLKIDIIVKYSRQAFSIKNRDRTPYNISLCIKLENIGGAAKLISISIEGFSDIEIDWLETIQIYKKEVEIGKESFEILKEKSIAKIAYLVGHDENGEYGVFCLNQQIEFIEMH